MLVENYFKLKSTQDSVFTNQIDVTHEGNIKQQKMFIFNFTILETHISHVPRLPLGNLRDI